MHATIDNMTITNPLVSIIVPCFNGASTIGACINSISSQTYRNIETIFVNDASTDDTKYVLGTLQGKYSFSVINNQHNIGAHESVNVGFHAAKGVFVTHMDVDDILPNDAIEIRVQLITHHNNIDFLLTAEEVHHNDVFNIAYPVHTTAEIVSFLGGINTNKAINTHAYLARLDKVISNGGRPFSKYRHHSDYVFVLKMLSNTHWVSDDTVTYIYNRADGVLERNMKHREWHKALATLEKYYLDIFTNKLSY